MKYLELLRKQLAALIERRTAIIDELDVIATAVEARADQTSTADEARISGELETEARKLKADEDALAARIAEMETVAQLRDVPSPRPIVPGATRGTDDPYDVEIRSAARTPEVRADHDTRARRALESMRLSAAQKEHVERRLDDPSINRSGALTRHILLTGSDAYRSAFGKLISDPHPILTEREAHAITEARAMTIGTDATGGFLMPFTLDPTLIDINAGVANPIRQVARIRTVMTDNWQGVTSAGVSASWDAEASEVSDDTPTFAQPAIPIRHPRVFVPFSIEAGDDFDGLVGDLTAEFGRAKDRLESVGFATGAGTGANPLGLITALVAASKIVTSAGADVFAVADLYNVQGAVPDRYDDSATWLMNKTIINLARQFATANNHALITQLADGSPTQLLGAPLQRWSSLDGVINAAAENYIAVYGDVSECFSIVDRLGMTVELIPHLFATANNLPSGQRGLYARWRVGSGVTNADACRVLNVT